MSTTEPSGTAADQSRALVLTREKLYMVCDRTDEKAASINEPWNIGVEYMGLCHGRLVREDGTTVHGHTSSSFGWLRSDLKKRLPEGMGTIEDYEIVDLIARECPERFRKQ